LPVPDGHTFMPQLLSAVGDLVESVTLREPSLDDVFLQLTGRSFRDEAAGPQDQMRNHGRMGGRH
jgi:ABC-2 type transport system ATP-binding protein